MNRSAKAVRATAIKTAMAMALAAGAWSPAQACVTTSYGECTLESQLDDYLQGPAPSASVDASLDATWKLNGSVGGATIIMELAGYQPYNTFGIYDLADKNNKLQIFAGADGASIFDSKALVLQNTSGGVKFSVIGLNTPVVSATFDSAQFGFYLSTPESASSTYYSNTAYNPDSVDHMRAFQGNGAKFIGGPLKGLYFTTDSYLLAWEDLMGGGDNDYQDMVVLVKGVAPSAPPVPLPAAAWLLVSGLASVAAVGRRRRLSSNQLNNS